MHADSKQHAPPPGHVLGCRFDDALPVASAPDCSLPTCLVEAVLPEGPCAGCDPHAAVGWNHRMVPLKVRP